MTFDDISGNKLLHQFASVSWIKIDCLILFNLSKHSGSDVSCGNIGRRQCIGNISHLTRENM